MGRPVEFIREDWQNNETCKTEKAPSALNCEASYVWLAPPHLPAQPDGRPADVGSAPAPLSPGRPAGQRWSRTAARNRQPGPKLTWTGGQPPGPRFNIETHWVPSKSARGQI